MVWPDNIIANRSADTSRPDNGTPSDADDDMLESLKQIFEFDHIFISEMLRLYKLTLDSKFFSSVIDHYKVKPENIMHIGDSHADVIGANKVGIVTCWLNINDRIWSCDIKPESFLSHFPNSYDSFFCYLFL